MRRGTRRRSDRSAEHIARALIKHLPYAISPVFVTGWEVWSVTAKVVSPITMPLEESMRRRWLAVNMIELERSL